MLHEHADEKPCCCACGMQSMREKLMRLKLAQSWAQKNRGKSSASSTGESKLSSPRSVMSGSGFDASVDAYDRFNLKRIASGNAFVRTVEDTAPGESHYFTWKRTILKLKFEEARKAAVNDELVRLATLAMRRAMLAEQLESRKYDAPGDDGEQEEDDTDDLSLEPGMEIFKRKAVSFKVAFALSVDSVDAAAAKRAAQLSATKTIRKADASTAAASKQQAVRAAALPTVTCTAFAKTSNTLFAVGCDDGTVGVCSTTEAGWVASLKGHTSSVSSIEWAEDDTYILTTSGDGTARLWTNLVAEPSEEGAAATAAATGAPTVDTAGAGPELPAYKWVCVQTFDQGAPVGFGTFIPGTNTRLIALNITAEPAPTPTHSSASSGGDSNLMGAAALALKANAKKLLLNPQKMFMKGVAGRKSTLKVVDSRNGKEVMSNKVRC